MICELFCDIWLLMCDFKVPESDLSLHYRGSSGMAAEILSSHQGGCQILKNTHNTDTVDG